MKVVFFDKELSKSLTRNYENMESLLEDNILQEYEYFIIDDKLCLKRTKYINENIELLRLLIKKQITMFYQPIFSNKDGFVYAYEALMRIKHDEYYISPKLAFDVAKEISIEYFLDAVCREQAILQYKQKGLKLFININPNSSNSGFFKRGFTLNIALQNNLKPENVVLEITESEKFEDIEALKEIIEYYKSIGFSIAFDDFGTGYNSLNILSQIEPDYIKFPIELIKGISRSRLKWQIVRGIMDMAIKSGIKTIAEGIENKEDLKTILELGIDYSQGFLLAMPSASQELPKEGIMLLRNVIIQKKLNSIKDRYSISKDDLEPIHVLKGKPDIKYLIEILKKNESEWLYLEDFDILINESCIKRILNTFSENLFYYKTIDYFFEHVDCHYQGIEKFDIQDNILHAYHISVEKHVDAILVKNTQGILGVLTKAKILEKLFDTFYKITLYTNPLTGLPGNVIIEKEIENAIEQKINAYVVHIDISNFKPFNDAYGFLAGDMMIKKLAQTLQSFAFNYDAFVGHIGGDDFVVIFKNLKNKDEVINSLYKEASDAIKELYKEEDIKNGYFVSKDREGNVRKFPIAKITLAAANTLNYKNSQDIARKLAELKKESKRLLKPVVEESSEALVGQITA
ncbi:EAL domain-containing protein [Hydrogenobaculum acidophilum]